jgi:hypothetical protein
VSPAGRTDVADGPRIKPVDLIQAPAQCCRVLTRRIPDERPVDVEQQQRGQDQRASDNSAVSFCANAAISVAAASMSDTSASSTDECM